VAFAKNSRGHGDEGEGSETNLLVIWSAINLETEALPKGGVAWSPPFSSWKSPSPVVQERGLFSARAMVAPQQASTPFFALALSHSTTRRDFCCSDWKLDSNSSNTKDTKGRNRHVQLVVTQEDVQYANEMSMT